MSNQANF